MGKSLKCLQDLKNARAAVLKVWSVDYQHWHHLGTNSTVMQTLRPQPSLHTQKLWCGALRRLRDDSDER